MVPYIEDTSVNGTFVNGVLVGKNRTVRLVHGDEVTLVAVSSKDKTWNPDESHGWVYQEPTANATGDDLTKMKMRNKHKSGKYTVMLCNCCSGAGVHEADYCGGGGDHQRS